METLKSTPRGYPKDHERIELLRHKGLVVMKAWPVASWLGTAGAKKRVVEVLRSASPLLRWLDANVGPGARTPTRARGGAGGPDPAEDVGGRGGPGYAA